MIGLVIFILGFAGASLLLLSGLALLRSKDIFTMTHVALIFGFYAMPLLLLTIELEKFSAASLIKIILLILFNFLATHLICYTTVRQALEDDIVPDVVADIER